MKVTVFGCGGWGSRVASKLDARPDVRLALVDADYDRARRVGDDLGLGDRCSGDPYGYLMVTGTRNGRTGRGLVVIATPPVERVRLVRAVLGGYGGPPEAIRIEKPLAETEADAAEIVGLCADAGVSLTVGFTLLHHPLYGAAFAYMNATGAKPIHVDAVRIGKPARHDAVALVDAGIHAAAVAAYLGVPAHIAAAYDDEAVVRSTRIYTSGGKILVDEVAGTVTTPHGLIVAGDGDALSAELDAWIGGTHRGTPEVALAAQRIIDAHTESVVAA
jgi:predicted dehydrogenase